MVIPGPGTFPWGHRERRRARTRQALQDAALRLSVDRGYERVTVKEIADACDVSSRTFFNYFTSKDEALLSPGPEQLEQLRQALSARPADESPLTALRGACSAYAADVAAAGVEQWQMRRQLMLDAPALAPRMVASFAAFERGLAEAVEARTGLREPHAYPALVAAVAVAAMRIAFLEWRSGGESASLPRLVEDMFDSLAAGLPAPTASTSTSEPTS